MPITQEWERFILVVHLDLPRFIPEPNGQMHLLVNNKDRISTFHEEKT